MSPPLSRAGRGDRTLGVEAPGVGAARGQVVGDAFDRCEVGCLVVETKLS